MRPHLILLPVVLFSTPAFAAGCATDFLGGKAPAVTSSKLTVDFQLCFDEYAVGYSATSRTPLWSAEDLTAAQLAVHVPRKDDFHAEAQLPAEARAEIADYSRTGFDKGHMTPADDESTPEAERQSFSLANMVPQNPKLNRGLWARIEKTVRDLAERDGQVYAVTGPIFADSSVVPDGRVRVPSETFKAIDDPNGKILGAYVADNSADGKYEEVSVAKLDAMIGLDVFPELTLAKGSPTANLPTP